MKTFAAALLAGVTLAQNDWDANAMLGNSTMMNGNMTNETLRGEELDAHV